MTGRPAPQSTGRRPAKLSRDAIVNAALTFLDRDGWDALTINALATQLGTKGPSLYNHVTASKTCAARSGCGSSATSSTC